MKLHSTVLATAIALTLAACGGAQAPSEAPAAAPAEAAPAETAMAPAEAAPAAEAVASEAGECAFNLEGNDAMQYNAKNIDIPASCTEFTIHLKHTGTMPVAAMGHNVVIAKSGDMNAVAGDGASVKPDHVKEGDDRVIAKSSMIGGGESTSVTFEVAKVAAGGYNFFCTFPGHTAMMNGTLTVK
ncbi:azurin [Lysobacteraceae bacterium NML120232]|nr:azurin [Xanthomonadaceae bacterium NML08-0793]PJK13344.1 azurin [Xanthomonadaceae bacterium NML120232]